VPTLLVTSKMSPELAARVQAAVSGRQAHGRPIKALLRFLTFTFVVVSAVGIVRFRQQRLQRLEHARAELLATLEQAGRSLTRSDRELDRRVASAVALESSPVYAGDQLPDEPRRDADLTEMLAPPTLYLRGSLDALARPDRLRDVASSSSKDAFLLCLLAPPDDRSEKALRLKASSAAAQSKTSLQVSAHVERLAPLLQALPLLGRDWTERVKSAETSEAVEALAKLVAAAPLTAAVRAAKARQLLLVLDETAAATGPTELDGERAHPVRVALVDLSSGESRLRFRGKVDPSGLSDQARAQYASGIDGCALALDFRHAVSAGGRAKR
jgi:hypothetical protein